MKASPIPPFKRNSNLLQKSEKLCLLIKSKALLNNNLLKRALILSLLIFFSGIELFAQHNFREGYIIKVNHDTLHRLVLNRSNSKNYRSCVFKKGNKISEYLPSQIYGFGYSDGKFYTRGVVKNSFAEVLVLGTLSLYKKEGVFYLRKNGKVHKLEQDEEAPVAVNNVSFVRDNTKWKGIISYLINDCIPNSQKLTSQLGYSEQQLTDLTVRYDKCRNIPFHVFNNNLPWFKIDLGGEIGMVKRKLYIKQPDGYYYYLPSTYSSMDPTVGLLINWSSPRFSKMLSFQSEICFLHSTFSNYMLFNGGTYKSLQSRIELTTLTIPVSALFTIIHRKVISLFIQAGFDYNINIQNNVKVTGKTYSGAENPIKTDFAIDNQAIGSFGGIGIQHTFKKVDVGINLRYYPKITLKLNELSHLQADRLSLSLVVLKR